MIVGVRKELEVGEAVPSLELVPIERVAVAEKDWVGATDRVETAEKVKLVVGLTLKVPVCVTERLATATVLVGDNDTFAVVEMDDEPAKFVVEDTHALPVAVPLVDMAPTETVCSGDFD